MMSWQFWTNSTAETRSSAEAGRLNGGCPVMLAVQTVNSETAASPPRRRRLKAGPIFYGLRCFHCRAKAPDASRIADDKITKLDELTPWSNHGNERNGQCASVIRRLQSPSPRFSYEQVQIDMRLPGRSIGPRARHYGAL